jgi:signal transduction histidine kinase
VSFRTRLFVAFGLIALLPLVGLGVGVRRELDQRLTAQYRSRIAALARVTRTDLAQTSAAVGDRLASLRDALPDDEHLRIALRDPAERAYLLDYGAQAMRMTGLDMLQLQDEHGRIVSSGQFRNEYDRLEPTLPRLLASGAALVNARTPDGPRLVLARMDTARVGERHLTIVGGIAVDSALLGRLTSDSSLTVALVLPAEQPPPDAVAVIPFPFIAGDSLAEARFVISSPATDLDRLHASVNRWFAAAVALAAVAATLAAIVLAARVGQPLAKLAADTERLDLDRLDVNFSTDRSDEIGTLSRVLGALVRRLRSSAVRLREAERRATIGDLSRQVTHDIKNGLAPLRHVLRHFDQVARDEPSRLAPIFADRRATLDASVAYLDALAQNYARLSPRSDTRPVDLNAIAQSIVAPEGVTLHLSLDPAMPPVVADPIVVRRIIDNLVSNAIDAMTEPPRTLTITTGASRVTIADTGCGMTQEQLARAFDDFYTTKVHGTGLGLSIVRRLVSDLGAALAVDTTPGRGTRITISFTGAGAGAA